MLILIKNGPMWIQVAPKLYFYMLAANAIYDGCDLGREEKKKRKWRE